MIITHNKTNHPLEKRKKGIWIHIVNRFSVVSCGYHSTEFLSETYISYNTEDLGSVPTVKLEFWINFTNKGQGF